ncbi:hypothetical protein KAR91_25575 [Candidatus Pacearchaeota archaeon]|nr:hypothetical protein [Candidatus Pacearchaeota archaeon]
MEKEIKDIVPTELITALERQLKLLKELERVNEITKKYGIDIENLFKQTK